MKTKTVFLIVMLSLIGIREASSAQGIRMKELYNLVLKSYVKLGSVKYRELCADTRLDEYISGFKHIDTKKLPTGSEELAFWINVYNASALKIICDNYPVKSINDLNTGLSILRPLFGVTTLNKKIIMVSNQKLSLNDIAKEKIWAKFKDPRIYFALNFAAKSCPPLRDESYDGTKINDQLNEQARIFLNDTTKNYFDLKNRVAYLSKIFEWNENNFGKNQKEMLMFISRFIPKYIANDIVSNIDKWEVEYKNFDWSLNDIN